MTAFRLSLAMLCPLSLTLLSLTPSGCTPQRQNDAASPPTQQVPASGIQAGEVHFADMRQITYGGENAEAYWSFDGSQLVFQSRPTGVGCDQIFRMRVDDPASVTRVSSGEGATTCAYFLPGDQQLLYASTHLGGAACPPKPDHSQGYVWPIYDSYDIFKKPAAGGPLVQLTTSKGYDAEATVCAKDGSIIFTSVRDGDLELYRMDADGQNVKRLTNEKGYDGGAFFNSDCSKIVWRASRPTGKALADYQRLLAAGLVRPTKLELYVANADGSDARQVTYLDAASFAPFWFPARDRILFSSNYGDPKGREFEIWAIDADGTDLERITHSPGFDGFPMFSPDGSKLAFSSNRATAEGASDTNVFVVRWADVEGTASSKKSPADKVYADIAWLADPARGGRGLGTPGLEASARYIVERFEALGLEPGVDGYRQRFDVATGISVGDATALSIDGKSAASASFQPLTGSATGKASAALVFAGYGIVDEALGLDDYAGVDAKGKIVLLRRFVPDSVSDTNAKRRLSHLRFKAWTAKQHGAVGLLVVDAPAAAKDKDGKPLAAPEEAPFPAIRVEGYGDADLPMMIVKRALGGDLIARLTKREKLRADIAVDLTRTNTTTVNLVGKLSANAADKLPGAVVVGAHYDHLGMGGDNSLAPDSHEPHLGADDNASGVAALLEVARLLAGREARRRDVWFVAFSAEEIGVLGSSHFVTHPPVGLDEDDIVAMLNMDMVGRMRDNSLAALGGGTASEWPQLVSAACAEARVRCDSRGDGYGPSDQTPFYAAGTPVLHFFTGAHSDYHKPSDAIATINAAGGAKVAEIVAHIAGDLVERPTKLSYQRVASPLPVGDMRSYGASLGSIPDYSGPKDGHKGVLLAGVRPGGAADRGGLKRGDILVKLSRFDINNVRDLMYALRDSKPDQTVTAVIVRDGKRIERSVTFQKSQRRPR